MSSPPRARLAQRRVLGVLLGQLALLAAAQACNDRFEFDAQPVVVGAAGTLPQAGVTSVAGSTSSAGSGGSALAGTGAGGSGDGGSGTGGNAAGTSATAGASGASSACGSRAVCPAPLHCAEDTCVQCMVDVDCAPYGLSRCDDSRHRCVACIDTSDCEDGFACDGLANRCLQKCRQDPDCPATAHGCDELRRVCYQCDEDQECTTSPLGHLCASDGSGCVQCRKDMDCHGQRCDQLTGRCVDCRDADGCENGLCNPMTGTCILP